MTVRATIILLLVALASCGDGVSRQTAVPRRTAYPRPRLLDTVMRPADAAPRRTVLVNAGAEVSSPRQGWLDVAYPIYGATMHITVTDVTPVTVDGIKANRMERVLLNAGGLPGLQSEWINPAGMSVMTLRTAGSSTPLQFLATDDSSTVVSGAVYFSDQTAVSSADSIAPVVDAIEGDIRRMLNNLENE
ncbi:MAG: hypothetical protein Q4C34_06085 [Bacteroidales bacterium]|nr:hypothetical protein [Bacteroidales bacterium]